MRGWDADNECDKVDGAHLAEATDKDTFDFFINTLHPAHNRKSRECCKCEMLVLKRLHIIAEDKYWVDDLRGSQATSYPYGWYSPTRSWSWKESGETFPSSDANDNWGSNNSPFFIYVEVLCVRQL